MVFPFKKRAWYCTLNIKWKDYYTEAPGTALYT